MSLSPLLLHSRQDEFVFPTSFTRPATASELSSRTVDIDGFPVSKVKFADSKKKLVWVDNPIITDVTQVLHTDIKKILSDNPDIEGLSLILDDNAKENLQASVCLEDFVEPSQYVDVFDVQNFVDNAKRSFNALPASLRKQFNNNPMELCDAINKNDASALAKFYEFLGLDPNSKSTGQESGNKVSVENKDVSISDSPDSQVK